MAGSVEVERDGRRKSDLSRAFSEDGALKTHVGGQALIEGIMMRGKLNWAVAVREPDGGIYVEEHELGQASKARWASWPVVRGVVAFVNSLVLGYKALEIAALHAFADEGTEEHEGEGEVGDDAKVDGSGEVGGGGERELDGKREPESEFELEPESKLESVSEPEHRFSWKDDFGNPDEMIDALGAQTALDVVTEPVPAPASAAVSEASSDKKSFMDEEVEFGHREMMVSMVLGLVLGAVLFVVLPAFVTNLIVGEYDDRTLAWNIVDGVLRVAVFVFYMWLIGRMKDIQRMFGYHGAEHKTIHCYEHGLPLTPENARSFPRLHVRCGTAFLIMVMIIAILVYTVIPVKPLITSWGVPDGLPKLLLVIAVRIAFMPLIAGIAYEITVKWAGSRPDNPLVKVILWPGMQMQRLTTNEPDDSMIECAIAAMQRVLECEQVAESQARSSVVAKQASPS
ncbi:DUF1385 domain-containing protein [Adlercreutzia sp. ZJ138]|uniref:DUF1385 domain-containing protein n=1 Tax=Adlercreutzia sp. ZJ138 TaxID=2709405 RepID=UPI001F14B81B|nr:DUF1385 domain-containing protein [Adlercreutzia sp. ZJ138]